MRKVVSGSDVCHFWANQTQSEARRSDGRLYFKGATIYSYGSHFPIASHTVDVNGNPVIVFNNTTYSSSTSKHQSIVRRAIPGDIKIIFTPATARLSWSENKPLHDDNFNAWHKEIQRNVDKLQNAKKPTIYIFGIRSVLADMYEYADIFGLTVPDRTIQLSGIINDPKYADAERIQKQRNAANQLKREEREAIENAHLLVKFNEELPKWRNSEFPYLYHNVTEYSYLRFNAETNRVETSQGVQVPAIEAHRNMNDETEIIPD